MQTDDGPKEEILEVKRTDINDIFTELKKLNESLALLVEIFTEIATSNNNLVNSIEEFKKEKKDEL